MFRITTFLFVAALAIATIGKYRIEAAVKNAQEDLATVERAEAQALRDIQMLRAEVAFLDSPERLAKIAALRPDLEPLTGAQILTVREFQTAFGVVKNNTPQKPLALDDETIIQALAMAGLSGDDLGRTDRKDEE